MTQQRKRNMRATIAFAVLVVVLAAVQAKPAEEKYTSKYDNINLDEILSNKRLLKGYVNCLLSKGNCTPDGAELKRVLPEALQTECAKCNDKQKEGSRKVFKFLIEKEPEIWADLEKAFDPTGEYKKKFCKRAKDEGIDTGNKCD